MRECCTTARDLRPWPKSPRTAGRLRGILDMVACPSGLLVHPAGPRTGRKSSGTAGRPHVILDTVANQPGELVTQECWSFPQDFVPWPEYPGTADRPVGTRTRTQVPRYCSSTPQTLEPGPSTPGTSGRSRGTWDKSMSRQGQMLDTTGPWTQARGALEFSSIPGPSELGGSPRDSWSTPRELGHGCDSSGRAGHPGVLVVPAGPQTLA